ncbi:MAG: hypothetical protein AAGN82_09610 [Myxococcota bacterium]
MGRRSSSAGEPDLGAAGDPSSARRGPRLPVTCVAIDDVAMMSLREHTSGAAAPRRCDRCGATVATEDEGTTRGLFLWVRGDDHRYEEPVLCATCSDDVGAIAYLQLTYPEDG